MHQELVQATDLLRRDTPESFEAAIRLLQHTVYRFSLKFCRHPEDAEDAMQEVVFRSLKHLGKFQDPNRLAVWLYVITRNRCWRMRRKTAHGPTRLLSLQELLMTEEAIRSLTLDTGKDPEGMLLQTEECHLLYQAILRIRAPLRIVLVLHDMEEFTTAEVAEILALTESTIRVRLHRARLSARNEMHTLLTGISPRLYSTSPLKKQLKGRETRCSQPYSKCRDLFANLSEFVVCRAEPLSCDKLRGHIESCPSSVTFLHDLRSAIDRCRSGKTPCGSAALPRLRVILTREYVRMLALSSKHPPLVM